MNLNYIEQYLQESFACNIKMDMINSNSLANIPNFIKNYFEFYSFKIYNKQYILAYFAKKDIEFTPNSINKWLNIISQSFKQPIVLGIDKIESYNRIRLAGRRIAYIIPGKAIFIPNVYYDMRSFKGINLNEKDKNKLTPSGQVILILQLLNGNIDGQNPSVLLPKINYSIMTINRSFKELNEIGLCELSNAGRKNIIHFKYKKRKLFEKSLEFFINPIKKTIKVFKIDKSINCLKSNLSTLSEYSNLSLPNESYYATKCSLRYLEKYNINNQSINNKFYLNKEKNIFVELWKYDPHILSLDKLNVDPISLFLCLKDDNNERVQFALKNLLNKVLSE